MITTNIRTESLEAVPAKTVTPAALTPVDILADRTADGVAIVYRQIQNLTGGVLYWCVGDTATQVNFHGQLADKATLQHLTKRRLSVMSVAGGGFIAPYELFKDSL